VRGVKRVCDARGRGCPPSALVSFEMPRHALHHRESSGVAWGAWLMDLRQDLLGESAKYLRCSSTAFCPAHTVESYRQVAFSDPLTFFRPEGAC